MTKQDQDKLDIMFWAVMWLTAMELLRVFGSFAETIYKLTN